MAKEKQATTQVSTAQVSSDASEVPTAQVPTANEAVEISPTSEAETQTTDDTSVSEDIQTKNFRALRKERDNLRRRVQEMEQVQKTSKATSDHTRVDQPKLDNIDELQLAPDDLAEGKHLNQVTKKIKRLEKQVQDYQQQSNISSTENRLRTQYTDFADVVSEENIETLKNVYPEIAKTLSLSSDMYSTAVSAYTLIKKLGIHKNSVDLKTQNDKERIQKNMAKPRPLSSVSPQEGDGPLSKANAFAGGLTPELKKQLWKEMQEIKKHS